MQGNSDGGVGGLISNANTVFAAWHVASLFAEGETVWSHADCHWARKPLTWSQWAPRSISRCLAALMKSFHLVPLMYRQMHFPCRASRSLTVLQSIMNTLPLAPSSHRSSPTSTWHLVGDSFNACIKATLVDMLMVHRLPCQSFKLRNTVVVDVWVKHRNKLFTGT